jgi:ribosomal protein S18 acetylase RimI-like enzyme
MADLCFRPIDDGHIDAVVDLWRNCGLVMARSDPIGDIAAARNSTSSEVLVGTLGETVAAAIMISHDGGAGAFYYVAVAPAHQRRGYGTAAIRAGEVWLRERGMLKVNILIKNNNASVRKFYEQLGYVIDPVFSMGFRFIPQGYGVPRDHGQLA